MVCRFRWSESRFSPLFFLYLVCRCSEMLHFHNSYWNWSNLTDFDGFPFYCHWIENVVQPIERHQMAWCVVLNPYWIVIAKKRIHTHIRAPTAQNATKSSRKRVEKQGEKWEKKNIVRNVIACMCFNSVQNSLEKSLRARFLFAKREIPSESKCLGENSNDEMTVEAAKKLWISISSIWNRIKCHFNGFLFLANVECVWTASASTRHTCIFMNAVHDIWFDFYPILIEFFLFHLFR